MNQDYQKVFLKPKKEGPVRRFHPWIFSGALHKRSDQAEDGDIVGVYNKKNELMAYGHYYNGSIAVKIFSFGPTPPTPQFWQQKIRNAYT